MVQMPQTNRHTLSYSRLLSILLFLLAAYEAMNRCNQKYESVIFDSVAEEWEGKTECGPSQTPLINEGDQHEGRAIRMIAGASPIAEQMHRIHIKIVG
jgi:hypothetical protein